MLWIIPDFASLLTVCSITRSSVLPSSVRRVYQWPTPGLKTTAKMFADDTKLYTRSDTEHGPSDLQDDLDTLQEWSRKWLLKFHPQKCCVLKVGRENENEYTMNQTQLDGETRRITPFFIFHFSPLFFNFTCINFAYITPKLSSVIPMC